jgi:hypothetical protein
MRSACSRIVIGREIGAGDELGAGEGEAGFGEGVPGEGEDRRECACANANAPSASNSVQGKRIEKSRMRLM